MLPTMSMAGCSCSNQSSGWGSTDSVMPSRSRMGSSSSMERNRSEEHTSELQSPCNLVCRLLLEKKKHFDAPCCNQGAGIMQPAVCAHGTEDLVPALASVPRLVLPPHPLHIAPDAEDKGPDEKRL